MNAITVFLIYIQFQGVYELTFIFDLGTAEYLIGYDIPCFFFKKKLVKLQSNRPKWSHAFILKSTLARAAHPFPAFYSFDAIRLNSSRTS